MLLKFELNGQIAYAEFDETQFNQAVAQCDSVAEMTEKSASPKVTGDSENYTIHYGNGLVKFGGRVSVQTSAIQNATTHTEGAKSIKFPKAFTKVLNAKVTAMDTAAGSLMEHAHVGGLSNSGLTAYASAIGNAPVQLHIMWEVEGVIE